MPSALVALGLLGLALALAASWRTLPCPHYWAARELHVLRMGANASSAAPCVVRPTLGSLLAGRSLGNLLTGPGAPQRLQPLLLRLLGGVGGIRGAPATPATDAYTCDGSR
jgi:hypothetical protein